MHKNNKLWIERDWERPDQCKQRQKYLGAWKLGLSVTASGLSVRKISSRLNKGIYRLPLGLKEASNGSNSQWEQVRQSNSLRKISFIRNKCDDLTPQENLSRSSCWWDLFEIQFDNQSHCTIECADMEAELKSIFSDLCKDDLQKSWWVAPTLHDWWYNSMLDCRLTMIARSMRKLMEQSNHQIFLED